MLVIKSLYLQWLLPLCNTKIHQIHFLTSLYHWYHNGACSHEKQLLTLSCLKKCQQILGVWLCRVVANRLPIDSGSRLSPCSKLTPVTYLLGDIGHSQNCDQADDLCHWMQLFMLPSATVKLTSQYFQPTLGSGSLVHQNLLYHHVFRYYQSVFPIHSGLRISGVYFTIMFLDIRTSLYKLDINVVSIVYLPTRGCCQGDKLVINWLITIISPCSETLKLCI